MLPALRALFNEPRRLWAGKGTKMQGYGQKKSISGVQATGTGGVLTLGRWDKSGTTPDQGSAEEPVELRAGQGVRLHGYGGIHTLERLSVPLEVPDVPGPAQLGWEIEKSWGVAHICTLGFDAENENFITVAETTYTCENGSFTVTITASEVAETYGPGDPLPDTCATPTEDSSYDPEFDYGELLSEATEYTLLSPKSIASDAIAALGVSELTETSGPSWPPTAWKTVSEIATTFTVSFGTVSMQYTGGGGAGDGSEARADNIRFRLRNLGRVSLRVDCGFYGSGISGGATDIPAVIDLAPGATSAWQEVPSIDPDPAKYYTAEIRRVRIGRWRIVA